MTTSNPSRVGYDLYAAEVVAHMTGRSPRVRESMFMRANPNYDAAVRHAFVWLQDWVRKYMRDTYGPSVKIRHLPNSIPMERVYAMVKHAGADPGATADALYLMIAD